MDTGTLVRGLLLGGSIAATFGPISLLCVRRTLSGGFLVGLLSGLGVATADATYGLIAALGISALTTLLIEQRMWLRLVGGVVLVYLGLVILRAPAPRATISVDARGLAGAYASMYGLTLTNPMTILSFAAAFAALGLGDAGSAGQAATLVAGVFLGSALWWLILTGTIAAVRARITPGVLRAINIGSGAVIVAFGVVALVSPLLGVGA